MNVGLRFMALAEPESGSQIPDWLIKKGVKGTWTPDKKTFAPDLDDPLFIQYSQRLLNAFGKRYDGNENLAFVDIGMVGSWGEWHNSNFPNLKPLLERYTTAQLDRYVAMHFSAFPVTPKTMLISGGQSLANAVARGAGWRADCWGDLRVFSDSWNHMADDYPQRLLAAQQSYSGFNDAWKRAPVSLEICSYMQDWKNTFHYTRAEVQGIFDWAVKQHASTINLKSRTIPSDYRPIVDNALTKLGYRFRLASLSHESVWDSGQTLTLNSTWYNEGIAPIYLPYMLAFRVVDSANKVVAQGNSAEDIRRWLPGKYQVSQGIFDWAVKQHASTINLKSRTIPSDYRPIVDNALTKLGYRFRLASLSHESVWVSGKTLILNSTWYNEGIAPIYLPYILAFRVVDSANKVVAQGNSAEDIRRWLPGKYQVSYALSMPGRLAKGQDAIEVAMLDKSGAARINFANEGKQSSGWYRVSTITVR